MSAPRAIIDSVQFSAFEHRDPMAPPQTPLAHWAFGFVADARRSSSNGNHSTSVGSSASRRTAYGDVHDGDRPTSRDPADGGLLRQVVRLPRGDGRRATTWLTIIAFVNSVIGAYYYLRVLVFMYMREPAAGAPVATPMRSGYVSAALILSAILVLALGLVPTSALDIAIKATISRRRSSLPAVERERVRVPGGYVRASQRRPAGRAGRAFPRDPKGSTIPSPWRNLNKIDLFVELIGGDEGSARASVEAALKAGKSVVDRQQGAAGKHGLELARLAEAHQVRAGLRGLGRGRHSHRQDSARGPCGQ